MKAFLSASILVALATAQSPAFAQTPNAATQKPVAKTTCKDYMAMDEVSKPKFIYYTVGYSKRGKPVSETFDVISIDKMQPSLDEYCRVHLTESAYDRVMKDSMASEKTNR